VSPHTLIGSLCGLSLQCLWGLNTPRLFGYLWDSDGRGCSLPSVRLGSIFVVGLGDRPSAKPGAG
jgi:hypothetical protein